MFSSENSALVKILDTISLIFRFLSISFLIGSLELIAVPHRLPIAVLGHIFGVSIQDNPGCLIWDLTPRSTTFEKSLMTKPQHKKCNKNYCHKSEGNDSCCDHP